MVKKIVVTGAAGFVGSAIVRELQQRAGLSVLGLVRTLPAVTDTTELPLVAVGDLAEADLSTHLQDTEVVIHAAARAHIMQDSAADPLNEYRRANVTTTMNLARQAAAAGVKRFVFISSVKVNGEATTGRTAYTEQQTAMPEDDYAMSKFEAEQALRDHCAAHGMEFVVIRPPLVYGTGVKANFASLLRLANSPYPLPLGAIQNRRSLVYLGNLVDFVLCTAEHPKAANQVFLVSDGQDVSLPELVAGLRAAQGRAPGLLPVPAWLLRMAGSVTGKQAVIERLLGSLQVDVDKARKLLGWQAPFSVQQGLAATVGGMPQAGGGSGVIRLLDMFFALCGLILGLPLLLIIYVLGLLDTGSPLFWQERVGRHKKPFTLVKFRTMKKDTASVASHLASPASITRLGAFLRKTKLDELPQLWNVLKGEMSLVGPRPNLFNQSELIAERETLGVYEVRPGITGLAQVNEIDMSTPELLAQTDARMIRDMSLVNYFKLIMQTVTGKGSGDRVRE